MSKDIQRTAGLSREVTASAFDWAVHMTDSYKVTPNLVYCIRDTKLLRLDVYQPKVKAGTTPVAMYIHGGGWISGSKERYFLHMLPYLAKQWAVVNIEYRLGPLSHLSAAVDDCIEALRWVVRNASNFNFNAKQLFITGHSSGAQLALTSGMLANLDTVLTNPDDERLQVAAIVSWFAMTDLGSYESVKSDPNKDEIDQFSPLSRVHKKAPAVITIHGDADSFVPHWHAERLHAALTEADVANKLVTVPGARHGGMSEMEKRTVFAEIISFLRTQGVC